jgi:hypothetical protein
MSANKCSMCGKFTKQECLKTEFIPDNHFSHEDTWFSCHECIKKTLGYCLEGEQITFSTVKLIEDYLKIK